MYQQMTEEEKIEFKQKMANQLNATVINRAEKMTLKLTVGFSICVLVCFVLILLTIIDVCFWTIYLSIPILLFVLGLYIPMAIHILFNLSNIFFGNYIMGFSFMSYFMVCGLISFVLGFLLLWKK